jgi:hypothetical protein
MRLFSFLSHEDITKEKEKGFFGGNKETKPFSFLTKYVEKRKDFSVCVCVCVCYIPREVV